MIPDQLMKTVKAIQSIRPEAQFTCSETYDSINWLDKIQTKPTEQEFNDALTAWQANYDAQEYAGNREAEYPPWNEQLDKIFHDGVAKWKSEMVQPVKDKYPKPE